MKNYAQGATVRITATFKNFAGTLTDPTVVTLYIQSAADGEWDMFIYDGITNIVRESAGVYHFDQDTSDASGVYNWRITGMGTAPGAKQGSFYVEPMQPDDESSSCSS